jgi:sarcosine oxidase, subunit gamma
MPDIALLRRQPDCSVLPEPDGDFSAALMPPMTRILLRGGADVAKLAGPAMGRALPTRPLASASADDRSALWLGPDEWLLIAPDADRGKLVDALQGALKKVPHSLVDISHRQAAFAVAGRLAARVLSSGCPLDLGLHAFPSGMVTRTLFHKAEVVIWRQPSGFHVEMTRSFAPYVASHLAEARKAASGLPDSFLP